LGTLAATCAISLATAIFSTIGGAVMAWIVARTDFAYKRLVTALTGLSFCFPGFILAMAWIIIGSPGGLINGLLGDGLGLTWLSILMQRWLVRRLGAATITGRSYRLRELALGRWRWLAYLICFGFLLNAFLLPAAALVYTSLTKFFVANPFAAPYTLRNY